MSKNNKKQNKKQNQVRRSRRRNAARRARNAEQRRTRRSPRARTGRPREREPYQAITVTRDGGYTVTPIPDDEVEAYHAYMKAHELLPPDHYVQAPDDGRRLAMALFTLEDPTTPSDAVLRAIMILAHIPDERALAALRRHATSGTEHATIAKFGADECAMWLEQGAPSPPPWAMQRPSPMVN